MISDVKDTEGFSFDGMSKEEIHDAIIRYLLEIKKVENDKKAFDTSCRDACKELSSRIDLAIETLSKM
jgi:hypothetical protein